MVFVLIALGGLVALILLALILVPMFIDEAALIALAQEAVRDKTGGELIVAGDSELSLFPRLAVELNDTQLILPARTEYEQAIDAKLRELSLGLSILPTLRGTPEFGELRVDGLHAKITAPQALPPTPEPLPDMSDRDWERLGRTLRSEREAQRQKLLTPTNTSVAVAIAADNLTITDITLELLDARGRLENKLLLERLTVRDINTRNEPVRIDTAATVQSGESGVPIQLDMTGVVRVPSDLSQISIDRLETVIAGALAEPVKATLTGKLTLSPLDFKGQLDAALPGGDVKGDLRYAALESPQIDVRLETERLDLDRMQPASAGGTNSKASAPSANSGGDTRTATTPLPPVPLPVGPLKLLDLALEMNAGELTTAGQTIGNAQLAMRVRDAIADIKYLRGTLHEGQLDTRATLNTRRLQAELAVEGGMKGINLDSLMSSLGTPGAVSGRVDMAWDVDSRGATAEALKLGLDGDFDLEGQDVVIEQISMQGMMCNAISQVTQKPLTQKMPTKTPLSKLALGIDFDDGKAEFDDLSLASPGLTMSGDGAVALDSFDFAMVLDTRIDKQLEELDPNCRVVERYAEIDWPIACRGNLSGKPGDWCRIDVNRIAEQLLKNEAKSQLEKKAGKFLKNLLNN
ncbi:MAG: AsmA family protein [Halieaceae bacterium]|jgi:uncharacterized protein involved in outer membrane biogenesis|nr:AsmA family protein [Halieaceae bacterium]